MIATPHPKGKRPPIRFISVCSGVEAASQALIPLGGFKCVGVAEIEPHPCHVLAHRFGASRPINMPRPEDVPTHNADGSHRFPQAIAKDKRERAAAIKAVSKLPDKGEIPNYGDMSRFQEWPDADVDALCGGTPCQSFSVAGLREGLADPRGNLMLTFGAIAARIRPRWLLWENVPGVLSSNGGRDFASFLGLITGQQIEPPADGWSNAGIIPGIADAYGVAYRVLDAQFVRTRGKPRAVPQRRRRVFVIGYLGDWRRAAAVLFDRESLRRDPPPRREAGQRPAPTISARPTGGGGLGTDFDLDGGVIAAEVSPTLVANGNKTGGNRPPGSDGDTTTSLIALSSGQANAETAHDHSPALTCLHEAPIVVQPVAPTLRGEGFDASEDGTGKGTPIIPVAYPLPVAGTLSSNGDGPGKHGFGMGQQDWENGYAVPVVFDSKGSQVQTDESGAAPTLRAMTHADSHQNGGGQLAVAFDPTQITSPTNRSNPHPGDPCHTLAKGAHPPAVAFDMRGREGGSQLEGPHDTSNIRASSGGSSRSYVAQPWAVRRLLPVECERLMGMEDDFTNVPWRGKDFSPDGNRYKELGNSWALNCIEWIGERMLIVDAWECTG